MKKIVPFNNILTFNTDVSEITAISLEHDIKLASDSISGVFHISGEYKITDGLLEKEPFNFDLPFDIALGNEYNMDTLEVDVDDFRYELVNNNELKVNIDLYLDGEIVESPEEVVKTEVEQEKVEPEEPMRVEITESLDLLDDILDNKEEKVEESTEETHNHEEALDIFSGFNEEEKYVTYRVYRVTAEDSLDKIMTKYNITKEELAKYNSLDEIKSGDKLIIPTNEE